MIVPPADLLAGTLLPEDIKSEQCKPLFVDQGEEPDEDQLQLIGWESYTVYLDQLAELRQQLRSGKYAESTLRKRQKELDAKTKALDSITCLHWEDTVILATEVLNHAGGAHRRFRPVEADVLEGLADAQGGGETDEPDAEAAA